MRALKFQQMAQGGHAKLFIGGSASASQTSSKTKYEDFKNSEEWKKMTPQQQAEYDRLLSDATDWLDRGGVDTFGADQMKSILGQQAQSYSDILSGGSDTSGLQQMLDIQRGAGIENLNQSLAGVSQSANMTGGIGGSRSGIAAGLATKYANDALADQQNKTIYDWQNQQQQNKLAATQGLGAVAGAYGNYQTIGDSKLQSLQAYKDLITGDMGSSSEGTASEESRGSSETTEKTVSAGAKFDMSDERLKKGVKNTGGKVRVNRTGAEINEKEYEYTKEAQREYGAPSGKQYGVLANDVEKEDPSAVANVSSKKKKKKKRKAVDYNKLSKLAGV